MTGRDRSKGPAALRDLVAGGSVLQRLTVEGGRRQALGAHLRAALPESLREGVLGCNLRPDGSVAIVCAAPEWAARLRFETETLTRACEDFGIAAPRLRFRVADGPRNARP